MRRHIEVWNQLQAPRGCVNEYRDDGAIGPASGDHGFGWNPDCAPRVRGWPGRLHGMGPKPGCDCDFSLVAILRAVVAYRPSLPINSETVWGAMAQSSTVTLSASMKPGQVVGLSTGRGSALT
jgi:hypothetical protein